MWRSPILIYIKIFFSQLYPYLRPLNSILQSRTMMIPNRVLLDHNQDENDKATRT